MGKQAYEEGEWFKQKKDDLPVLSFLRFFSLAPPHFGLQTTSRRRQAMRKEADGEARTRHLVQDEQIG